MDNRTDRIIPLDELNDFKVAEGDPDVRGWDVLSADGRKIGEVDNLLVDTAAMKVRYLDVDIDEEVMGAKDRHVLIPIGYARLDEDDDRIFVDTLTSASLRQIPEYRHDILTPEYESSLRSHFGSGTATPSVTGAAAAGDFYADDLYDADRFYSPRRGGGQQAPLGSGDRLEAGTSEPRAGEVRFNDDSFHNEEESPGRWPTEPGDLDVHDER